MISFQSNVQKLKSSVIIIACICFSFATAFNSQLNGQENLQNITQKTNPQEFQLEGILYFSKKSYKISNPDLKRLQTIAEHLIANPQESIYIRAHAWDGGSQKDEILLSEKRSLEVERFLTLHGVKENQIHRLFYGNSRPMDHGITASDQSIQRRVEFQIVKE